MPNANNQTQIKCLLSYTNETPTVSSFQICLLFLHCLPLCLPPLLSPRGWPPQSQRLIRLGLGQSEAVAAGGCTSTTSAVPAAKHRLEGISFLWGRSPCAAPPLLPPPTLHLHGVTHSLSCCKQEQA